MSDAAAVDGAAADGAAFDAAIRAAQDRLARAAEIAKLAGDPSQSLIEILATHVGALVHVHRAGIEVANRRLDVIDGRLDELHDIEAGLRSAATGRVEAAKAEITRAQAEMSRQLVGEIAASTEARLAAMSRAVWLKAVGAGALLGLALLAGGGALGFAWGRRSAARTIATADALVHFVAVHEGPGAVHDWAILMRYNPIKAVMAGCDGKNVATQNGRKACHMWLWTGPPAAPTGRATG